MPRTQSWPYNPYITPDDPEFEAKVRSASYAAHHPAIRREDATYIPTRVPTNLMGFSTPRRAAEEGADPNQGSIARQLRRFVGGAMPNIEYDKVYGVGLPGRGATTQTWAHEFRHLQPGGLDEYNTRLGDAFTAGSRAHWREAVESYADYTGMDDLAAAEKRLVEVLRRQENPMAELNGMERPGIFASVFGRPKKQYAPYRHWTEE